MENNYHKDSIHTYYQIADANWGMYHSDSFDTEEEARMVMDAEYTNRSTGYESSDEYWRKRPQVILKITVKKEVLL